MRRIMADQGIIGNFTQSLKSKEPWWKKTGRILAGPVGSDILFGSAETGDEQALREFARRQLTGKIDPVAQRALETAIARRYGQIRQQTGANLARQGLYRSSIQPTIINQTYDAERESLANALAAQRASQQQLGAGILTSLSAQDQQAAADQAATIGKIATLAFMLNAGVPAAPAAAATATTAEPKKTFAPFPKPRPLYG